MNNEDSLTEKEEDQISTISPVVPLTKQLYAMAFIVSRGRDRTVTSVLHDEITAVVSRYLRPPDAP